MNDIDKIIICLFNAIWCGDSVLSSIDNMRDQLHKSLTNQVNGWWSGSSAYRIMINGGFLVDGKSCTRKKLTVMGEYFIDSMGGLKHDRVNKNAK